MVAIIIDLDSKWSHKLLLSIFCHFSHIYQLNLGNNKTPILYFSCFFPFLSLFHYNISFQFYFSPNIEVNFNCVRYC